jgi:hypothetical protein
LSEFIPFVCRRIAKAHTFELSLAKVWVIEFLQNAGSMFGLRALTKFGPLPSTILQKEVLIAIASGVRWYRQ